MRKKYYKRGQSQRKGVRVKEAEPGLRRKDTSRRRSTIGKKTWA